MPTLLPEQLLYFAASSPLPPQAKEKLVHELLSGMWENPKFLLEAIAVYSINAALNDGSYLTREEFDCCVSSPLDEECAGNLLVHLSTGKIDLIQRQVVEEAPKQFEYALQKLLIAYAESVTFDKTADQFLHAILRTRLDAHRLAITVQHEMPYEKLSRQLDLQGEGTSNDIVGPIIDEPIAQRIKRLDIRGKLDPELWILSLYMIIELLSIESPLFLVNHMLAFEDNKSSWAYCNLSGEAEFGFIDTEVRMIKNTLTVARGFCSG
jgi:hypothetical protein